jgi:hypothetical protein
MALFGIVKMQLSEAGELLTELIMACGIMLTPNKPFGENEKMLHEMLFTASTAEHKFALSPKIKKNRKVFASMNRSSALKIDDFVQSQSWSDARDELSEALQKRVVLQMISYLEESDAKVAFDEARELVFEKLPLITQDLESLFDDKDKQSQIRQIETKIISKWRAMGLVYKT